MNILLFLSKNRKKFDVIFIEINNVFYHILHKYIIVLNAQTPPIIPSIEATTFLLHIC